VRADITLAPPFTDHAVLQREIAVPVWGWSDEPGAMVTVTFAGQLKQTLVNQSGLWRADLDPMPANSTGADLVVTFGEVSLICRDVVVGEVWLAAGQSNMEWTLGNSPRSLETEKAEPADPLIRHLRVIHTGADLPASRVDTGGWRTASPDSIGQFSAVAYYFAKAISRKLRIPVGILNASWGGTSIESWIPEPVVRSSSVWQVIEAQFREESKDWQRRYAEQPALEEAWRKAWLENQSTGKPITMPWPRPPMGPGSGFAPARLYNGMIAPFAPYALRGALWYQGVANVGQAREYAELLPALIRSWRSTWPLGDFPFLIVQLPNYSDGGNPDGLNWAEFREAQERSARAVPATGLAIILDNEEPGNLHPFNKRPVGERLALLAEAKVYGLPVESEGPTFAGARSEGAGLRVSFTHAAGLTARGDTVTGFEISGADRVFHPASARIDGESALVSAAEVPEPVAVRYAFSNAPAASLYNAAGLPAAPFRTDDW
jgi:sialate O-acetylesterase